MLTPGATVSVYRPCGRRTQFRRTLLGMAQVVRTTIFSARLRWWLRYTHPDVLVRSTINRCQATLHSQHIMNSIGVIAPYKYEGMWVFDDPAVGLVREPFISGIDAMIDRLVASIPDAENGFRLLFSASPFPGHTVKLEWRREEFGGNWYYSPQFGIEGWLCPALFKYFDNAPRELYGRAEQKKG